MKFDFIIGNPPYQEDMEGTSDNPVYNYYMDAVYGVADKVELITPARFLFNAGKTPKDWNKKMLDDEHLKILKYWPKSGDVFQGPDIMGGIVITYRDNDKKFGAIKAFSASDVINHILSKILNDDFISFNKLIYAPESYRLSKKIHNEYPEIASKLSNGHLYDLTTNIFSKLNDIFLENNQGNDDYIGIMGRENNTRTIKFIHKDYIDKHDNLNSYKVIVPKSNGSPTFGNEVATTVIGNPILVEPNIGHNQTFISIGSFNTRYEAESCLKYIKSKFARALIGTLKVTQDNKKSTWLNVPVQNFTKDSDIDWSKSISEIDKQLYKKYGLDDEEIEFIETHVKEMK